jgi:hypothetical protein
LAKTRRLELRRPAASAILLKGFRPFVSLKICKLAAAFPTKFLRGFISVCCQLFVSLGRGGLYLPDVAKWKQVAAMMSPCHHHFHPHARIV